MTSIVSNGTSISIPCYKRQYLKKDDSIDYEEPTLQLMTSWNLLYRLLRHNFPDKLYHNEIKMICFEQIKNKGQISIHFEGFSKEQRCNLLVGADGLESKTRRQVLPQISPNYSGYVSWRGLANESEMSSKLLDIFSNKFTFFIGRKTHILCYLVPGTNGDISIGKRRLNWVWYVNTSSENNTFEKTMTDKDGKFRAYSVPYGLVNEDIVKQQKDIAEKILPKSFQQLVFATREIFIQAIYDLYVPKMVFDRACLIGDASFIVRPHTAAATSKAVKNAISLAKSIRQYKEDLDTALRIWEKSQLSLGNYIVSLGIKIGNNLQK